jgi:hypothetical protein
VVRRAGRNTATRFSQEAAVSRPYSTPATPNDKPAKPSPDLPLRPHVARVWAKKIRGKLHYFGPWSDPEGAQDRCNAQKDDLLAGSGIDKGHGGPGNRPEDAGRHGADGDAGTSRRGDDGNRDWKRIAVSGYTLS